MDKEQFQLPYQTFEGANIEQYKNIEFTEEQKIVLGQTALKLSASNNKK